MRALEEPPYWRVVAEHADLSTIGRLNSATNPNAACIKDDRRLVDRYKRRLIIAMHRSDEFERLAESDKLRRLNQGAVGHSEGAAQMAPGALALSIHAASKPMNKTAAAPPSPFC